MHAYLSRLIGSYAYSVICIHITILIIRAPPLTIVGRAHGSARTAVPCMCALLFTHPPAWHSGGGTRTPVKVGRLVVAYRARQFVAIRIQRKPVSAASSGAGPGTAGPYPGHLYP